NRKRDAILVDVGERLWRRLHLWIGLVVDDRDLKLPGRLTEGDRHGALRVLLQRERQIPAARLQTCHHVIPGGIDHLGLYSELLLREFAAEIDKGPAIGPVLWIADHMWRRLG